jgi:hypothetical protein
MSLPADFWEALHVDCTHVESLRARRAIVDGTNRMYAAVDVAGKRHFLVLLQEGEGDLADSDSRGLRVVTRDLAVPGEAPGRYLDLTCDDPGGHDAFDLIGAEVARRLARGDSSAGDAVSSILAKWRRFWGRQPRNLLSRAEQLGLFAELWFLANWLGPAVGFLSAVNRWRGPLGARHDFEWPQRSVEVKVASTTRGVVHRVHGLEQLVPVPGGELFLFSLAVREEAGGTFDLPGAVAGAEAAAGNDAEGLSLLSTKLIQLGYSPAHEEEYKKLRLRVVEENLYQVHGDFPRLTTQHLTNGLPDGVVYVEYDINLSGFQRYRVPRLPADRWAT